MKKPFSIKVLKFLLITTLVLLGLHLLFQYLNFVIYQEKQGQIFEISNRVDFDDEVGLPTWFSQFLLFAIGCAGILTARLESGSRKKAWGAIGLMGILFSIDEVGSIHEFVLQSAHLIYYGEVAPTAVLNAWWLVLPFVAVAGLLFLRWLYKLLPTRTWWLFLIGGVCYLSGAIALELISNDFAKMTFFYQGIITGAEETFEMLGSIIVLYGVIDYLETNHLAKLQAALKQLKSNG